MSSPSTNETFLQWDPAQVSNYISSILPEDQKNIGSCFLDNNIEGSLLPFITTQHLKELGIVNLHTRLLIKKSISELMFSHYEKNPPKSLNDPEYQLNNVNINNNYISLESLTLSTVLMQDMFKKLSILVQQQQASTESISESASQRSDLKRLNENFTKLKTDLIPVIRLLKDSKPLPTPTLDPGPVSLNMGSPTYSVSSNHSGNSIGTASGAAPDLPGSSSLSQTTISRSNSVSTSFSNKNSSLPSPTYSNRFSSGSLLSMGSGKIVQHSIAKPILADSRTHSDLSLHKAGIPANSSNRSLSRPHLVETKSSNSAVVQSSVNTLPTNKPSLKSLDSSSSTYAPSLSNPTSQPQPPHQPTSNNEPLKQLRASSEDSCLKILQQAMKRHHIPRDDWSKYVLVICYGDKERILKLDEKPVIIFKELQELGKHPAIMLRQLAATSTDTEDSKLYEDSRIGDDIPGGTL